MEFKMPALWHKSQKQAGNHQHEKKKYIYIHVVDIAMPHTFICADSLVSLHNRNISF
jgi:hypothetical protein